MDRLDQITGLLSGTDGADNCLLEAAKLTETKESRIAAREVCYYGLNKTPAHLRLRLLLAKLFYLDGMMVFATRELQELKKYYQSEALNKLIASLGGDTKQLVEPKQADVSEVDLAEDGDKNFQELIAEIDLDEDLLEILDEDDNKE
ncbi:MAG: hypothetical protein IT292_05990 [Deltaproteobacteria bacterium]|nr:hypothetical protein [Deltaproteobacteria bacterium]